MSSDSYFVRWVMGKAAMNGRAEMARGVNALQFRPNEMRFCIVTIERKERKWTLIR